MEDSKIKTGFPHKSYLFEVKTIPTVHFPAGYGCKITSDPIVEIEKFIKGWPEKNVRFTLSISPVIEGFNNTELPARLLTDLIIPN